MDLWWIGSLITFASFFLVKMTRTALGRKQPVTVPIPGSVSGVT